MQNLVPKVKNCFANPCVRSTAVDDAESHSRNQVASSASRATRPHFQEATETNPRERVTSSSSQSFSTTIPRAEEQRFNVKASSLSSSSSPEVKKDIPRYKELSSNNLAASSSSPQARGHTASSKKSSSSNSLASSSSLDARTRAPRLKESNSSSSVASSSSQKVPTPKQGSGALSAGNVLSLSPSPVGQSQTHGPKDSWAMAMKELKEKYPEEHERFLRIYRAEEVTLSKEELRKKIKEQAHQLKARKERFLKRSTMAINAMKVLERTVMSGARIEPTGGAAVACAAVFTGMQIASNRIEQEDSIPTILLEIISIHEEWKAYEQRSLTYDHHLGPASQALRINLVDLYVQIMILLGSIAHYRQRSEVGKIGRAIISEPEQWKKQLDRVKAIDKRCAGEKANIKEGEDFQKQNARLLNWISTVDPSYQHQEILDKTKVGTLYSQCGRWLIDGPEYKKWRDGPSGRNPETLWLHGTVGTGKTTLMSAVIQDLHKIPLLRTRLVWHYCSRANMSAENYNSVSVLRSIVRQMAWVPNTNSIAEPIDAIYNRLKLNRPDYGQLSPEDCVRLIKQVAKGAREEPHRIRFRIIIDALDECNDAQNLLEYLYQAKESCGNIFFMFSSRPDVQIPPCSLPAAMVNIEAQKTLKDMRFFIRNDIQRKNTKLPGNKRSELEDILLKELCERAGGMFRWTQLQLEDFLPSTQNPRKLRSKGDFYKRIQDLRERAGIENLDQVYKRIYEANTPADHPSREDAEKAFRILLCCFRPLSLDQLAQATLLEEYGEESSESRRAYILDICCNFIIESHSVVQFAHVSARDYLESRKIAGVNEFDAVKQHAQAALSSLWFCESNCGEILKHIKGQRIEWIEYSQLERSLPVKLRFGLYAAMEWAEHASKFPAAVRTREGLSSQIARFLFSRSFRDWQILTIRLEFGYAKIFDCLVPRSNDETLVPSQPNPLLLISAFGFSECLEFDDINRNFSSDCMKPVCSKALFMACRYGHAELVSKILIELPKHVSANRVDLDILRAWEVFCMFHKNDEINESEIVSTFLEHGGIRQKPVVHQVLKVAAVNGHLGVLEKVVRRMTDEYEMREVRQIMSQNDYILLTFEPKEFDQYHRILEFFLDVICERKADGTIQLSNLKDVYVYGHSLGETILFNASNAGFQAFQLMTEKFKVPLNARDREGNTALHCTPSTEVANYILRKEKSMLSARNSEGYTPIITALLKGNLEVWQTLLRHGAKTHEGTRNGRTGLHLLSMRETWEAMHSDDYRVFLDYYLKQGLAGFKDNEGNTALHLVELRSLWDWMGETLLARNNNGEAAVEKMLSQVSEWEVIQENPPGRPPLAIETEWVGPQHHRIIIHLMEELRQEERKRLLDEDQRQRVVDLCYLLREHTGYDDSNAAENLRQEMQEGDEILLGYLEKQAEFGWRLPIRSMPRDTKTMLAT
ncbi:hypothetical protein GJ744_008533 [Endocarpon pusillum]|uniref:Nephrocystin 3-like N-terminal domain-containing protein n=1 Tax=Endocarpon pusillum TaxID=364733 RepID=A0A8H7E4E5_9EURO|nr:hypothetical protein GJ744_008533 [Endocarpon pusillum]